MNQNLSALYVAIKENEVVVFESNLKEFVALVNNKIEGSRNYQWFYREFTKSTHFSSVIGGEQYYFQKVL